MPFGPAIGLAGAAVSAGGALAASGNSSGAATSAANESAQAQQTAAVMQQSIANENTANLAPFKNTGIGANYSLANLFGVLSNGTIAGNQGVGQDNVAGGALTQLMGLSGLNSMGQPSSTAIPGALAQFANSPTYQFAQQQGLAALNASAAARGTAQSGAQAMATQQYGQGLASQQLGTYTTNLQNLYSGLVSGISGLANQGENAAATTGQQGIASAGQIGQSVTGAGNALAAGTIGAASAQNAGLNNSLAALTGSNSSYGGSGGTSGLGGALGQLATGVGNWLGGASGNQNYNTSLAGTVNGNDDEAIV